MIALEGWSAAGLTLDGPGAAVEGVRDRSGALHVALVFRSDLADHPMLGTGMDPIASFVKSPGVAGVAPLVAWDRARATFVYPASDGVVLAVALDEHPPSVRAALELLQVLGPVLDDAARAGRRTGLPGHGSLSPWRILVHPSGQATLVGHGLPPLEITTWLDEETDLLPGASLRFFPPERIDEQDEDLRSDLYSLGATAAELALGRPLLTGDARALVDQILDGRPARAVLEAGLDPEVAALFAACLAKDPARRVTSGRAIAERASKVARSAKGAPLGDLARGRPAPPAAQVPSPSEITVDAPAKRPSKPPGARVAGPLGAGPEPAKARPAPPGARVAGPSEAGLAATRGGSAPPVARTPAPSENGLGDPARGRPAARPARVEKPSDDGLDEDTSISYSKPDLQSALSFALPAAEPQREVDLDGMLPKALPRSSDAVRRASTERAATLAADVERTDVLDIPYDLLEAAAGRDPNAPPPAIPDLAADAPLERIQDLARKIVERSRELAVRAAALTRKVVDRAGSEPTHAAVVRAARASSDRAKRAADAAKSAAGLIDLDEDSTGALITLDLVRNAELQCEGALADVAQQLKELDRVAERVQAQAKALADAARRATDHANRATDAANQADDLVTVLEEEQREGLLSADGITDAVEQAIGAAERAHRAAEEARVHAEQAGRADRADLALRYAEQARRGEEQALTGLGDTREAAEAARRVETEAKVTSLARAVERHAAAKLAAEEAWRALSRADDALKVAATAESKRLRDRCAGYVRDAEAASHEAERAQAGARTSEHAKAARVQAETTDRAALKAEKAASEAAAASDQVVRLAGALAETRARLSKLQEEARTLAERARTLAARTRDEVDRVLDETSRLTGEDVLAHRTAALESVRSAEDALGKLDEGARAAATATATETVEAALADLRKHAGEVSRQAEEARARAAQARGAADAELSEARRREETRKAVAQATTEARQHARRCREQVDAAWRVARNLSDALRQTDHEEAARLRTQALEIIDIAEFQAGEAAASAENAAVEQDPEEARGHAQTAASFLERITADLPEALDGLNRAEQLARREVEALDAARARTVEIATLVEQLVTDARAQALAGREDAIQWGEDPPVAAQLRLVDQAIAQFDEDRTEAGWARDRAERARSAAEVSEYVPTAEGVLARARDKKKRADAQIDALRRAVAAAQAAQGAVQDGRKNARAALEACAAHLQRLTVAEQRLREAITRHAARDEAVVNAEIGMREALAAVRRAKSQLEGVVREADGIDSADAARVLAARAVALRAEAEQAAEAGAEAETHGIAAAEQEARARLEAVRRKLEGAREEAVAHARRALLVLERVDHALDEAAAEGAAAEAHAARARFDEATRLGELLRSQQAELDRVVDEASATDDPTRAQGIADRARGLAEKLSAEATRALAVVQDAVDLARAAAAEAEALESVRAEARSTADRAEEAVERARAEARRILAILREVPRSDVRALADEAAQQIQVASKAAAKARAATPLADQADTLEGAQSILRTTRSALDRANTAADAVRGIVDRAAERLRHEKESAARAIDEARARAAAPAQEAVAAAKKAEGWLEAGRRELTSSGETPATRQALKALEKAAGDVRKCSAEAAANAARAAEAGSIEEADAVAVDTRVATESALEAARLARSALEELRAQLAKLKAEADSVATLASEAADQAAAASQVAEQGEATLRELEAAVESLPDPGRAVLDALEAVRTGTTNARFAAATAGQAAERAKSARTRAQVEPAIEQAQSALEDALDALERVVEAEVVCRTALEKRRNAAREHADRAQRDQRRRDDEASRRAAAAEEHRTRAEDEERRRRDDERRARFDRRREERTGRTSGAANDRESLRSMLKSRPAAGSPPDLSTARPRRLGESPTAAREKEKLSSDDDPSSNGMTTARKVRSWAPSSRAGDDTTGPSPARRAGRLPDRPTGTIPKVPKVSGRQTPGPVERASERHDADVEVTEPRDRSTLGASADAPRVDALLERLRSRRSDKD